MLAGGGEKSSPRVVLPSGFPQGCPPESCCPGTRVSLPRARAGCSFVRTEGNQEDVATLLCSSNCTWYHESPREPGCGQAWPRCDMGTSLGAGSLPAREGHDVHLQHMKHSETRKNQALFFISTFLDSYADSEAISTTLQCK